MNYNSGSNNQVGYFNLLALSTDQDVFWIKIPHDMSGKILSSKKLRTGCNSISGFSSVHNANSLLYIVYFCMQEGNVGDFYAFYDSSEDIELTFKNGYIASWINEELGHATDIRYKLSGKAKDSSKPI